MSNDPYAPIIKLISEKLKAKEIMIIGIITISITGITKINKENEILILSTILVLILMYLLTILLEYYYHRKRISTCLHLNISENEIQSLNKKFIKSAEIEIKSFSGRLTTVYSLRKDLEEAAREITFNIKVLCEEPLRNDIKAKLKELYNMDGIEVRYYPPNAPYIRGMISNTGQEKKCLFVSGKSSKTADEHRRDAYIFGGEYSTEPFVEVFDDLFSELWDKARDADIVNFDLIKNYIEHLRRLEFYKDANIQIKKIDVCRTKHLSRYLNNNKYVKVRELLNRAKRRSKKYNSEDYLQVCLRPGNKLKVIFPPIIEIHDEDMVIIDGQHRIKCKMDDSDNYYYCCVIEGVGKELAGDRWEWEDVQLNTDNVIYTREKKFKSFKKENWRDLKLVYNKMNEYAAEKQSLLFK